MRQTDLCIIHVQNQPVLEVHYSERASSLPLFLLFLIPYSLYFSTSVLLPLLLLPGYR